VTSAGTHQGTGLGVHVIYSNLSYNVDQMGQYFLAFADIWHTCCLLALRLYQNEDSPATLPPPRPKSRIGPVTVTHLPRLRVHRLSIQSPMEITFAVEGAIGVVALSATRLFARVLRHPEQIGAWLPRVIAGWHQGMREADRQRQKRRLKPRRMSQPAPQMEELIKASNSLLKLGMSAQEVTTIGADELPDDLLDSDTS